MRIFYRIAADGLFALHVLVVVIALFGWAAPSVWVVYLPTLVLALLSDVVFGYCIFSKWEFDLRRRADPAVDYNYTWASYYTYKLINRRIPDRLYSQIALVFLALSIVINLYLHFS